MATGLSRAWLRRLCLSAVKGEEIDWERLPTRTVHVTKVAASPLKIGSSPDTAREMRLLMISDPEVVAPALIPEEALSRIPGVDGANPRDLLLGLTVNARVASLGTIGKPASAQRDVVVLLQPAVDVISCIPTEMGGGVVHVLSDHPEIRGLLDSLTFRDREARIPTIFAPSDVVKTIAVWAPTPHRRRFDPSGAAEVHRQIARCERPAPLPPAAAVVVPPHHAALVRHRTAPPQPWRPAGAAAASQRDGDWESLGRWEGIPETVEPSASAGAGAGGGGRGGRWGEEWGFSQTLSMSAE